jgi:hypothetical protein
VEPLTGALKPVTALWQAVRPLVVAVRKHLRRPGTAGAYETVWLDLAFDIADPRGERVVLTRRQRVRLLRPGHVTVRELVWGEGEPLVRYQARGAQRVGERFEGSKRAVLLDLDAPSPAGNCVTITSRRTMRRAFLAAEEYCEAFLERPTGRLSFTVRFPATRPPRRARLVAATTEQVLRLVPLRYAADGRPVLRCRIQQPAIGTVYSLRWSW